jgi:hypothetical protein
VNQATNMFKKLKSVANGYFEMFDNLDFEQIDKAAKIQATQGDAAARKFVEECRRPNNAK